MRPSGKPSDHAARSLASSSTAIGAASTAAALTAICCVRPASARAKSARANPYHNAWTESFIGTLKTEMLQDGSFIDGADARVELFAYIESYSNTHRKHSSLGYKTPASFEAHLNSNN